MSIERDKFLTDAMGFKYEGYSEGYIACRYTDPEFQRVIHVRLSPWEFFGKLWEWAREQEWWGEFLKHADNWLCPKTHYDFIHPDRFADALCIFLKERL